MPTSPTIVLDTNVVLDWLVFRDPSCEALGAAIERRQIRWLAAAVMHAELVDVLGRGVGAAKQPDPLAIGDAWRRHAVMCELRQTTADAAGAPRRCVCTDPDDQPFIDLALQCGARWLLSRDRAVLQLAPEARKLGLEILAPVDWSLVVTTN